MNSSLAAVSILFALAVGFETFGVYFRYVGSVTGNSASGYSMHVRTATTARVFLMVAAPLLGYCVDMGVSARGIAITAFSTFVLLSLVHYIIYIHREKFVRFLITLVQKDQLAEIHVSCSEYMQRPDLKFVAFVGFSFFFVSSAIFLVNMASTVLFDLRGMLSQSGAWLTFFGTALHVYFIDPKLARGCDIGGKDARVVFEYVYGRILGSLLSAGFFVFVLIFV